MKNDEHLCSYKHCKHPNELIQTEQDVRKGSKYYHKDCYHDIETIKKIREFYVNNVSKTVVISYLNKVINTCIYSKNISADYLLFAIKFAVSHNQKIKAPAGLYYIIDNTRIKEAYNAEKVKTSTKKISVSIDDDFDFTTQQVVPVASKRRSFADILKGGADNSE